SCFLFQAEDGIRDWSVTGVQTCALPIWLTTFTDAPAYEHARQELNTFVNALMIDVAAPVAEAAGLAGMLGRARDFLTNQIEAGEIGRASCREREEISVGAG